VWLAGWLAGGGNTPQLPTSALSAAVPAPPLCTASQLAAHCPPGWRCAAAACSQVSTRVTRRSAERPAADRLLTSEYFQQLISTPQLEQPKVGGVQGRVGGGRRRTACSGLAALAPAAGVQVFNIADGPESAAVPYPASSGCVSEQLHCCGAVAVLW
jgi:hypothetical protein